MELAEYLVNRFSGRWPRFVNTLQKVRKQIIAEWARNLVGWTREDVDKVIEVFSKLHWREKLKGYAPDIDDFKQARGEVKEFVQPKSGELSDYENVLRRTEARVFELCGRKCHQELYTFLLSVRSFLGVVKNGLCKTPYRCTTCQGLAVGRDSRTNDFFCNNHLPKAIKDALEEMK